ncbi:hypothetical protein [Halobacteriovorax marinus]|nr:hypothetical protein [Halobacteriovorax marinus]
MAQKLNTIDSIGRSFIQLIVLIEYFLIIHNIHGIESWWGVGLTLLSMLITISIPQLYATSAFLIASYATYMITSGFIEKGEWGGAIIVGLIAFTIIFAVNWYAFSPLDEDKKDKPSNKNENDDSKEIKDEVA